MLKNLEQNNSQESILYNNILLLSRNKLFYTKFELSDTFQNRIHLIFMHISFIFAKIKHEKEKKKYEVFYQSTFDLIFRKIEIEMREIGYGDTLINKNMKLLVKTFYNILLNCENFKRKSQNSKNTFFSDYLDQKDNQKEAHNMALIKYFDAYQAFCLDLSSDSVLKGVLNFNYK
tara:strand:- start:202 stop:726 length:525 start_codon:yes stop_codon:yes gene_type:complete